MRSALAVRGLLLTALALLVTAPAASDPLDECRPSECVGGAAPGKPCAEDAECTGMIPDGTCVEAECMGGADPGTACTVDADCPGTMVPNGTCERVVVRNPCLPLQCIGGGDAGQPCRSGDNCASGECGEPDIEFAKIFVVNQVNDPAVIRDPCVPDDETEEPGITCSCEPIEVDDALAQCDVDLDTCTLREAVLAANKTPNKPLEGFEGFFTPDIIWLCEGDYQLAIEGEEEEEDPARTGDLDITESVEINTFPPLEVDGMVLPAPEVDEVVIHGSTDRVFHVHSGGDPDDPETVPIEFFLLRVTVKDGGPLGVDGDGIPLNGGAILSEGFTLVSGAVLEDNHVEGGDGGAVHVGMDGDVTIDLSTLRGNTSATGNGGGISNDGLVAVLNSTLTGNTAGGNGGALYNFSTNELLSALRHTTIAQNTAGKGDALFNAGNELVLISLLIDEDGCDVATDSSFRSDGGSVESPLDTCGLDHATDTAMVPENRLIEDALVMVPGATPVFPLVLGILDPEDDLRNFALDAGAGPCFGTDQRRFPRPYDAFADIGDNCDAGAFEARRPRAEKTFEVTGDVDLDGNPEPGDTLTYTVTVTNDEELFADPNPLLFDFTDTLDAFGNTTLVTPDRVIVDNGDVIVGNNPDDNVVQIENALLEGKAPWTVMYEVLIDPELPDSTRAIENQGAITFQDRDPDEEMEDFPYPQSIPTDDPFTFDVEDPTLVRLSSVPLIFACKSAGLETDRLGNGDFNPGDSIRYTVVLTNEGERDAENAVFEDVPHRDSTLVVGSVVGLTGLDDPIPEEAIVSGNGEGDTSVRIDFDTVEERAGKTVCIQFDVDINDPIPLGCTDLFNRGTVTGDNFTFADTDDPSTPANRNDPTRSEIVFSPFADERTKFKVKLDFEKPARDKTRLRVKNFEIPIAVGPGTVVTVDQEDHRISGALDASGRFRSETGERVDTIRLKSRTKTVKDVAGEKSEIVLYKLLVKSKKADIDDALADSGLVNADVDDELLAINTVVSIGSDCSEEDPLDCFEFRANLPVFYKAKAGRSGKGKTAVQTLPILDCPLIRPPPALPEPEEPEA